MFLYYHARILQGVCFDKVSANPKYSDLGLKGAYRWLEKEIGFYPLFLSVGCAPNNMCTQDGVYMTGYQDNWRVKMGPGRLRKRGEFPNIVFFSFEHADGVFMDYQNWHIVLNAGSRNYRLTDYEKRLIFKPSWTRTKWIRFGRTHPHSVQLATPRLSLMAAKRIWVRNRLTQRKLLKMGFVNVEVRRIPVDPL